jgi:hypothetical protein
MAVDGIGIPYVAYEDAAGSNKTTVKRYASYYTITYDGNTETTGNAPADSNNYNSQSTVSVLGNTGDLSKIGHTFAGRNTQVDGSGTNYTPGDTFSMPAADMTLYANWTINQYTLEYTSGANGSISGMATQTVNYGVDGTTVTAVPDLGYHFTGGAMAYRLKAESIPVWLRILVLRLILI